MLNGDAAIYHHMDGDGGIKDPNLPDAVIASLTGANPLARTGSASLTDSQQADLEAMPVQPAPHIPLDQSKAMIVEALGRFDPALAADADEVLNGTGRLNIRHVGPGEGFMMQSRAAGLAKEDALSLDQANIAPTLKAELRKAYPRDDNPLPHAVVDFDYDGTVQSTIMLAHETGHAIADMRQRRAGNSYRDNPTQMAEFQAYTIQHAVAADLAEHPDLAIAAAATRHIAANATRNSAHLGVSLIAHDALEAVKAGHTPDRDRLFEARLGGDWQQVRDRFSLGNNFKVAGDLYTAMDPQNPDAGQIGKIAGHMHSRPVSYLTAGALVEHLKGQEPETRRRTIGTIMGADGPKGMVRALEVAGIDTPEKLSGMGERALDLSAEQMTSRPPAPALASEAADSLGNWRGRRNAPAAPMPDSPRPLLRA